MSERSQNRFSSENGWAVGSINMGPTFHPPPYHSVPSEVPNFTNSIGPPQVPYPLNNVIHSSDSLKPESMKFNAAFCPPYSNDANSLECVRMDNLKQQNTTSSYNHVPIFSHPLHSSNHTTSNFTPSHPVSCVANVTKNFTSVPPSQGTYLGAFNSSSLPVEQPNSFHNQQSLREVVPFQNLPGFQPHPTIANVPPQPLPNMFSQRQVYSVPPPAIRCPPTVESMSGGNFQQFTLPPHVQNFSPEPLQYSNIPSVASPTYPRLPFPSQQVQPYVEKSGSDKERLLTTFLENLQVRDKERTKSILTIVEFRSALKMGLSLTKTLLNCKQKLTSLLHCDKDEWNGEIHCVNKLKKQLSSVYSVLSSDNLSAVQKRLTTMKKKRALKSRLKQETCFCRLQRAHEREALHQEIDKWLDGIKEKNLKLKREAEMKKEADNILAEVRRKIHEVKRATEKLKVFEKLRATRQANAEQKGLYVAAEHGMRFTEQMGMLRGTLAAQLLDYEGEEHALRVMLEAEQEGQLEQEALWRLHKTKAMQRKKQQAILEGLFGHTEEPVPADPLFLFYQHQNAGNCSIDALVQIRHHWDVHLAEIGDTVPQQWVVPFPPSSATWEVSVEIT